MTLLLAPALLALCLIGSLHSLGISFHSGLFAHLSHPPAFFTIGPQPFPAALLPPPWPPLLNRLLTDVVAFFTVLGQAPRRPEQALAQVYVMAQLYGVWQLVQLEGFRRGNRGRLVGRTVVFGLLFQCLSITFVLPLYLILHLLTRRPSSRTRLAISAGDQAASIPAGLVAFILPASLIFTHLLPAPMYHMANAAWQVFPATQQLVLHPIFRSILPHHKTAANPVYTHVIAASALVHAGILAALAVGRPAVAPRQVFVPYAWDDTPVLPVGEMTRVAHTLGRLALSFVQWDVYCAAAALLLWSWAEASVGRGAAAWLRNALRAGVFTALGGPAAAAAVLLRERDGE